MSRAEFGRRDSALAPHDNSTCVALCAGGYFLTASPLPRLCCSTARKGCAFPGTSYWIVRGYASNISEALLQKSLRD